MHMWIVQVTMLESAMSLQQAAAAAEADRLCAQMAEQRQLFATLDAEKQSQVSCFLVLLLGCSGGFTLRMLQDADSQASISCV